MVAKVIDIEQLVRQYLEGASCADLATAHGLHKSTVAVKLRAAGVALRPPWVDAAVKNTGKRGPAHHNFKGEQRIKDGYVLIYLPDDPEADRQGYVLEHRKVWRDANGPIPDGWHVHHHNHHRNDNRLENLKALPPEVHFKHHAAHRRGRPILTREQLRAAGRKGAAARWGHPLP